MIKRTIVLVRHAQTQLSTGKRLIGRCDVELSGDGVERSKRLGEALKAYSFSYVFSSDLKRAFDTAKIICSVIGGDVIKTDALGEISLGEWDGRFVEDIKSEYPEEYAQRGKDIVCFRPPGGENFVDLRARVLPAVEELLKYKGSLLIVAHASVNRMILGDILGHPFGDVISIPQDYGCINSIAQEGGRLTVVSVNDTSYLNR